MVEALGEAHLAGHPGDDAPVRQRPADRVGGRSGQGEAALRVDQHPLRLGPERGGQHHVGVGVGLGVGEHILGDDEFGGLQPGDDGLAVGDRGDRIGADDPARLDLPLGHPGEHLDGAPADLGAQRAGRHTPELLGEGPFRRVQHRPLPGQAGSHVAHLPAAHRVGLAGEGERAAAGAADRAGRQVQVDQGVGVPGAVGGLVEPHRPAARPLRSRADHPGGGADVLLGESGGPGDLGGRVVRQEAGHLLPALGELLDEGRVGVAVLDQQVQQSVEQRQVRTGPDLEEEVGLVGGRGAPGVDDDQLGAGLLDPVHHPQEQDRVAVGHVGADDEEHVGVVEVAVRAGRPVRAQRQLVAAARARHAQPGVGLDLVGADEALGELVHQVLGLQRHLARDVEGQRVRPVLVEHRPQPARRRGDRRVHVLGRGFGSPRGPDQRGGQPPGRGEHVRGGGALGAQPAAVDGVVAVPGRLDHGAPARRPVDGHVEQHAAADTAVRADGANTLDGLRVRYRHHGSLSGSDLRPRSCRSVPSGGEEAHHRHRRKTALTRDHEPGRRA